ncbi:MAG: hypothetical protein FJ271_17695 [Planctomycetes bacterium]|nr:hypothetical protein [Planctomycetota bacterium]
MHRDSRFQQARARLAVEQLEERTAPALLGQQLFPADNPWNQNIAAAPVAGNSQAIIDNIIARYGNGRLHPDFGQDYRNGSNLYGIPFNVVHGNALAKTRVIIDAYDDESDIVDAPIPAGAVLEGDFQNGPRVGVNNRGDSHLLVWDVDNNIAYEFYRASRPSENADGRWHADQQTVWDMKTNTFRTLGWTSADAAGLSLLAGLVRPDEALPVNQGGQGVINHAIRFTLRNDIILQQYQYPASHVANPGNNNAAVQPPMGARFRLKASVDISGLNPQSKVVAQAMKDYGMIVADNGSNFFFSGASSSVNASNQFTLTWNDNDIQSSTNGLKSLRYSDFEVVDLTPIVTGLSVHSGAAGTQVTVIGQNFSGAAGRLQVLFGNTAASSVTVLNDSHVLAIAPDGTGIVDVRVQSGVANPNDPYNYKGSIFGYGISAVSSNARYSFTEQILTAVSVSPATATVKQNKRLQLAAVALDQFNGPMAQQPSFTWSIVSGPGTISATGIYQASRLGTGTAVVRASTTDLSSDLSSDATITIIASRPRRTGDLRGPSQTADINGDGLADVIQQTKTNAFWVWMGTDAGPANPVKVMQHGGSYIAGQAQYADINGDGRDDLIFQGGDNSFYLSLSTGTAFGSPIKVLKRPGNFITGQAQYADVNGDGLADLIFQTGSNGFLLSLSTGASFAAPRKVVQLGGSFRLGQARYGDINGDGRDDLVFQGNSVVTRYLSTGAGFAAGAAIAQPGRNLLPGQSQLADADNDGLADLLFQGADNSFWLYRAADNFSTRRQIAKHGGSFRLGQAQYADSNGDGRLDLIFQTGSNTFWISYSTSTTYAAPKKAAQFAGAFQPGRSVCADVNGDGRDDLLFLAGDLAQWLALSRGNELAAALRLPTV